MKSFIQCRPGTGTARRLMCCIGTALLILLQAPARAAIDASVRQAIAQAAVPFAPNAGQWDKSAAFAARTFAGTLFVTTTGALVYSLPGKPVAVAADGPGRPGGRHPAGRTTPGWVLTETFVDADQGAIRVAPQGQRPGAAQVSYFTGDTAVEERRALDTYERVGLGEVFPGIDVQLRATGTNVEKIFTVAAGQDPGRIRLAIGGATRVELGARGELIAHTGNGPLAYTAPVAFQEDAQGNRQAVDVRYVLDARTAQYGFALARYDTTRPLVIDPLLQSSYIGGNGYESVYAVAVHPVSGEVYVAGYTGFPAFDPGQATGFPGLAGGAQPALGGTWDAFVSRFSPDLTRLIQSTYLGGTGYDAAYALAIHPVTGDVYVAGGTATASGFPGVAGSAQPVFGGATNTFDGDGFVSRFSADLKTLIRSTYLGGTGDDSIWAMAIHPASGDVYVAGATSSAGSGLPGAATGARPANGGGTDAFVSRLSADLTTVRRSSYLGAAGSDSARAIAIHPVTGEVYVAGSTDAPAGTFPQVAAGAQPAYGGGTSDAFVSRFSADLGTLLRSTYLGQSGDDAATALAVHPASGELYVVGGTTASSAPFPGAATGAQKTYGGGFRDAFVSRLSADLAQVIGSSYLGAAEGDFGTALAIHPQTGEIYVAGGTYSPASSFPGVANGAQPVFGAGNNNSDAFISRFSPDLATLIQSTYLGQSAADSAQAIAIHPATGDVYVGGSSTFEATFPGLAGGAQAGFGGGYDDGFVSRLSRDLRSASASAVGYQYASQFGTAGTGPGQFKGPSGLAVDRAGKRLLVTDANNHRVQVFTLAGQFVSQFGTPGTGDGQFNTPVAVAVDPVNRDILVVDTGNSRVQVFDAAGAFKAKFGARGSGNGQFSQPYGVAIDPLTRRIVVADPDNNRIQMFDRDGTYLNQVGAFGYDQAGTFVNPIGVAVDPVSGGIVVGDRFGKRVHFVDSGGNDARQVTGDTATFIVPTNIAIDPVSHNILVTEDTRQGSIAGHDDVRDQVQILDAAGVWLGRFGSTGSGNGQFSTPWGIAIDPDTHNVYVADSGNNRVQVFAPIADAQNGNAFLRALTIDEHFVASGATTAEFQHDAMDPGFDGSTFNHGALVRNKSVYTVTAMPADTGATMTINGNAFPKGSLAGSLGLATFDAGTTPIVVQVTAPNGTTRQTYRVEALREADPPALRYAYRSQMGGSGTGSGQFATPAGVAIDPVTRNVIVVDGGNNRVQIFSRDGAYVGQFGGTGAGDGQLSSPWGVAIDPVSRDIVVSDQGNRRVQIYTAAGVFKSRFGTEGDGNGQFYWPTGVAIDPATRNIVVTDGTRNSVQIFTRDGTYLRQFGTTGAGAGQLNAPAGVAVDPGTGNIVVADSNNHRVQIYNASGVLQKSIGARGSLDGYFLSPAGVAIDPVTHHILVADTGLFELVFRVYAGHYNHRIQEFTADGTLVARYGSAGAGDGQFRYPSGIAIDPVNHHVVVADSQNNRIQTFAPVPPFVSGSVVEYYNPDLDNYFITADPGEQSFVDSGAVGRWQRTGNAFNAGGPELVCRFYGNSTTNPATGTPYGPNSHFYSIVGTECTGLIALYVTNAKSWKFESYDFATTRPLFAANDATTCPSNLVPVYRAYNNGFARGVDSNHRITSNLAAYRSTLAAGWTGEGVVMCAPAASPQPPVAGTWTGTAPAAQANYYSADSSCRYTLYATDMQVVVTLDGAGRVSGATASGTLADTLFYGTAASCPGAPAARTAGYTLKAGSDATVGQKLAFDLNGAAGNVPASSGSFAGSIVNGSLNGTLTLRRTDVMGDLAWVIMIPVH